MSEYVLDGRYALIERIATGGMGEVWRGSDQILGRAVAIKMLAAMHAEDQQFRARFRAEAQYAASLSHPGIARVFDYGENSPLGGPYLIMELVDGQPLSEILERYGRLAPDVVLDIIGQAARALDAAHQSGIVHRDIKPGNLLIMANGTTKITDFGIAKANSVEVNLTATGIVMGTALYVSPEQATGSQLSGASDVYSLGIVAYECLSGHPPFIADQPLAIAIMHKHNPVPPLPRDVPPQIRDLVYAMLAKTPDGRPESARHVAGRAEVIREARMRSGYAGPETSDLPVVPNFPPVGGDGSYQEIPERARGSLWSHRALLVTAGGVAVIAIVAIVVVLLSSGGSTGATMKEKTRSPARSASEAVLPATATLPVTASSNSPSGTTLETQAQNAAPPQPAKPSASRRQTPSPAQDSPPKSTSPSASATHSTPTPTGRATSSTPVPTPSTSTGAASSPASPAAGTAKVTVGASTRTQG